MRLKVVRLMKPSFHPRLINDPFSDPGLFIPFLFEKRALLFDLGELSALSAKDILKISHIFITHTHMDHFIGFDTMIRYLLGRDKEIHLYGPLNFIQNVEAKLNAYTWNLIENYENNFSLIVSEIQKHKTITKRYCSKDRFKNSEEAQINTFTGNLLSEKAFSVNAVLLDHKVDCIGLSLEENYSINIKKEGLKELELPIGPWLREFKNAIYKGTENSVPFRVIWKDRGEPVKEKFFLFGELKKKIAMISPGQKITYITDIVGSPENIEKAITLAWDSNHLFIEAPFLEKEKSMAKSKYHLTAREAGIIGARAKVRNLTTFHYSPRYFGREIEIVEEAMTAFKSERYLKN